MSSRTHRILQNCGVNFQIPGTISTAEAEKHAKSHLAEDTSTSLRSDSRGDATLQINSPVEIATTYNCGVVENGAAISITDNELLKLVTFNLEPDACLQNMNIEILQYDTEPISNVSQGVFEIAVLNSDQGLQDKYGLNQSSLETGHGFNNNCSLDVQIENEIASRSEDKASGLEREEANEYRIQPVLQIEDQEHQAEAELERDEDSDYGAETEIGSEDDNKKYQKGKSKTIAKARKQESMKRIAGEKYLGYKRRQGKISYNIPRPFKRLRDRGCSHTEQTPKKNGRTFLCGSISETKRQHIFNHFWRELQTWGEKRAFIKGLVAARRIIRRRKNDIPKKPKKLGGYDIHLSKDNGDRIRVCRAFFLSTLDLGEDTFKRWVQNKENPLNYSSESENEQDDVDINEDGMGAVTELKQPGSRKRKQNQRENIQTEKRNKKTASVRKWLSLVPKVPSHYCRRSSQKIYVESAFRSVLHMYNIFLEWCNNNNIQPIGRKLFVEVLKQENIAIHKPRKDQCDTCSAFKTGNIDDATYQAHVEKKDRSRAAKKAAKESVSADRLIITMDLESVLLCPKTLASSMYYKQKLQVHNFTIYELNNGSSVHLYVWNEVEGGVTANEFTSCIVHYIRNAPDNFKEIVLISDGCTYQNRNKVLTSTLSDISKEKQITIEQLYLEKGHTMMEADSVHSVLEHLFKPPINSPSDYVARMRLARPKHPYNVIVVNHDFFLDYDTLPTNLSSIRPGKKVGEPTVTDIRQLQYLSNGEINYKLDYNTEWVPLPQRRPAVDRVIPSQLYLTQIPITESKYRQLQELKPVIEREHHAFYDSLPYAPDTKDNNRPSTSSKAPKRNNKKFKKTANNNSK